MKKYKGISDANCSELANTQNKFYPVGFNVAEGLWAWMLIVCTAGNVSIKVKFKPVWNALECVALMLLH